MIVFDLSTSAKLAVLWIRIECYQVTRLSFGVNLNYFRVFLLILGTQNNSFLHCTFLVLFYLRINKSNIHNNSLTFQVVKIRFRIVQAISVLRVKLWKVVTRKKICFLLFLDTSSQNVPFQCLIDFFLVQQLSNQQNFSVKVCIYKIHVFDVALFLLTIRNPKVTKTFQGGIMLRPALTKKFA